MYCKTGQITQGVSRTSLLLQDKNLRTLALSCLCQCFHGYLVRLGPAARAAEVNAFLSRHMKTILQNLRKNNLQSPDQHVSLLFLLKPYNRLPAILFTAGNEKLSHRMLAWLAYDSGSCFLQPVPG